LGYKLFSNMDNLIYSILTIPIVLFLAVYLLFKWLEYRAIHLIVDIRTGKPLSNRVSSWYIIKERMLQKKHNIELIYPTAQRFRFENYQTFITPWIPMLVISNAEDAKKVLLNWNDFPKASELVMTSLTKRFLGENLVLVNGSQWKVQRSVINPAFFDIDRFATLFSNETFKCLHGMEKYVSDKILKVPIAQFTTALALDVLGLAAFGYDFNMLGVLASRASGNEHSLDQKSAEYVEAYHYLMQNTSDYKLLIAGKIAGEKVTSLPIEKIRKFDQSITKMDELVFHLITRAQEAKKKRTESHINNEDEHPTLLDLMIDSSSEETGKHMTEKEIRDNIIIFFLAGHDTTSASLAAALFNLAKHPCVQDKLIQEIDGQLEKDELNVEKIKNLEYLGWVIKESLRLHPPVPLIPARTVANDYQIVGNCKLKKGAVISINAYNIHHNPKYWKEPFEFRPERFSVEESKGRPSTAWIPFGGGARVCIGNNFSLLEQRIFLSTLLQRYRVELPNDVKEYPFSRSGVLLSPDPNMCLLLKKRN
jgi:cytochrome P450